VNWVVGCPTEDLETRQETLLLLILGSPKILTLLSTAQVRFVRQWSDSSLIRSNRIVFAEFLLNQQGKQRQLPEPTTLDRVRILSIASTLA
jgi:hypothetical protein